MGSFVLKQLKSGREYGTLAVDIMCKTLKRGNVVTARHLLEAGVKLTMAQSTLYHETILHAAASSGSEEALRLILAQDEVRESVDVEDDEGCTPLLRAAESGNFTSCKLLAQAGADVNKRCNIGRTPLHEIVASEEMSADDVMTAIMWGCDTDAADVTGETPFTLAMDMTDLPKVKVFIRALADMYYCAPGYGSCLASALILSCPKCPMIKLFVEEGGGDVSRLDEASQCCALHMAAADDHDYEDGLRILLEESNPVVKVNLDVRDGDGMTPLHYACAWGQKNTASIILHHGAKLDVQDKYKETPLFKAARRCHLPTIRLLLRAGANDAYTNVHGKTPVDVIGKGDDKVLPARAKPLTHPEATKANAKDLFATLDKHRAWWRRGWVLLLCRQIRALRNKCNQRVQKSAGRKQSKSSKPKARRLAQTVNNECHQNMEKLVCGKHLTAAGKSTAKLFFWLSDECSESVLRSIMSFV